MIRTLTRLSAFYLSGNLEGSDSPGTAQLGKAGWKQNWTRLFSTVFFFFLFFFFLISVWLPLFALSYSIYFIELSGQSHVYCSPHPVTMAVSDSGHLIGTDGVKLWPEKVVVTLKMSVYPPLGHSGPREIDTHTHTHTQRQTDRQTDSWEKRRRRETVRQRQRTRTEIYIVIA